MKKNENLIFDFEGKSSCFCGQTTVVSFYRIRSNLGGQKV